MLNVGIGVAPFGIDVAWIMAVLTRLIAVLGEQYGFVYSKQEAGLLLEEMLKTLSFSYATIGFGMKFMAEALEGVGVITMGGVTLAGMALDGVLNGAVTYAVGYTTKKFLEQNRNMSTNEMRTEFRQQFAEGRVKAQGVIQKLAADAGADMRERAADVAHGVEDRLNMLRQKGERLTQRLR